jgi:phage terminase large subunit
MDSEDRLYLLNEIYRVGTYVIDQIDEIKRVLAGRTLETLICDSEDPAGIATLKQAGLPAVAATKGPGSITAGVALVAARLGKPSDAEHPIPPRLFIVGDSLDARDEKLSLEKKPVCTAEEFEAYSWPIGSDGKPTKEVPIDKDNHGLSAVRYVVQELDRFATVEPGSYDEALEALEPQRHRPFAGARPFRRR